jgi:hypothetical protein
MQYQQVKENIFVVTDFLSKQECQEYMVLSEGIGYEQAKINTASGA